MKICEIDDCEWWIGESLEACKAGYLAMTSGLGDVDGARELTDDELDRLTFIDFVGPGRATEVRRTFREQLAIDVAQGGKFPRMFATTEY